MVLVVGEVVELTLGNSGVFFFQQNNKPCTNSLFSSTLMRECLLSSSKMDENMK